MAYYNIVTQSNESTVVAEYTASPVRSDAYQSESDLEREFIALLKRRDMNICLSIRKPT